ncbi:MAG: hypothetical protein IKW06_02555 [Clostridia bacterium]|nr:hypothetical protein [Clostridia bacterium]
MNPYDDIINLPHPEPKKHKRASLESRAAQFGAFRALSGHEEAVEETARITDSHIELSENMIEILNGKILMLKERIDEKPTVSITFFKPDEKKEGGAYLEHTGRIKKINDYERTILFTDFFQVEIPMIIDIQSDIFIDAENFCEL